ncbi:unnamed protein product [Protopolystoma xenopodis]|uniref:Uncharacterized protein n=1 Tax=Protopolystoma xenopodis TaxID=117903 RepID=A0A3S5AK17_9PLAT|nr:unnamed protein product [Protopolystoma xenopodis]
MTSRPHGKPDISDMGRMAQETQYSSGTSRYSSRQSSVEPGCGGNSSRSMDPRELRSQLQGLEEKFKSAMVANAQMDNEKQVLR